MEHQFYRVFAQDSEQQNILELIAYEQLPREHYQVTDLYTQPELVQLMHQVYPNGISYHGEQYLFNKTSYINIENDSYTHHTPMLELAFELVRQWKFPQAPSRFASFFGWETLEDAEYFNDNYRAGKGIICRVSCESYLKVDMNLLYLGASLPATMLLADRYWRGEASGNPRWEVLMKGPVNVLKSL